MSLQFEDLQDAYLMRRRQVARHQRQRQIQETVKQETVVKKEACKGSESYQDGLEDFESVLTAFTRYSRLRVIAELHHGDLFHSSNIVSR
jgi:E3 ubiquitin-protein ligase RFWD2